ncbi:C-X-C motif chemokine 9 [Carassius carassius]|uniref:C-X-C motif chemokine 9 n=1 Tax=Carassius carassius TaxID=217509 RepID=UPI002868CC24|nr:C-X-C motif chemokine 9 [Carassius carassius]
MTLTVYALLAFNLSILLTVVESQYIPKTCECPQAKIRIKGPISDFKVTPKRPKCLQDEIIVTLQKNNSQMCLSPEGQQGKRLLKCWQSTQKDGKDSKKCIRNSKRSKART